MSKVYIISAVRTPIGSFGGVFKNYSATQLGGRAIAAALSRANTHPDQVQEVFMGNVCSAGLGQAPARQASIYAGIPHHVPATTINKVCASGMKSIIFGAQSIQVGHNDIVVCGGMENMSMIPYYAPHMRWGSKYGHTKFIDGLQQDGLTDVYDQQAMGVFADATAEKYGLSREEQDRYAIQSYHRAAAAWSDNKIQSEVIPVEITTRKGSLTITEDEEYKQVKFDKIPVLRPAFSPEGTITAANASTLNDGASAVLLASESAVKKFGLRPLALLRGYADAAHEPQWFTTAPISAAPKALNLAGTSVADVELWEVNEAFSVVPMVFAQEMNITEDKINPYGGAVSLGHPLGASGTRIVTTLVNALQQEDKQLGCAAICNGGGGASAVVVERLS